MRITYRRWTQEDAVHIHQILHDTWLDAYSGFIPREDILGYLDKHYHLDAIKNFVENEDTVGFIADVDGVLAAYEKTFYNKEEKRLYVHQLYVLPQFQGLGLGKQLMAFAAERAETFNLDCVWLGVMVDNTSAVLWYQKMGYQITEKTPFVMGKTTVDHYIGFVPVKDIVRSSGTVR